MSPVLQVGVIKIQAPEVTSFRISRRVRVKEGYPRIIFFSKKISSSALTPEIFFWIVKEFQK